MLITFGIFIIITAYIFIRYRNRKLSQKKIAEQKQKYVTSSLSEAQKEAMAKDVIRILEEKRLYIDSNLTLDTLAIQVNTNKHYLSQVINEQIKKNFYTFLNEYRVKETQKLLLEPEYENVTIEGIGNLVGFKSKSSFNTAFKKITGMTPSEFQKKGAI
ncbi:MAG: AraC family transcriptional regulator [Bacteroidia bacterium]|nr:AraC family transcriptional regulator [Bacteroidia bacterium]